MTRRRGWSLAVALAAVTLAVPATAEAASDVSLLLGAESLSEDRFDDAGVSGGFQYGVLSNLDFGWPVTLALDLLVASDDATQNYAGEFPLAIQTDVDNLEFHAGVRRFFRQKQPFRPYLGGGLSFAQLQVKQVESGSFGPGTEYSNVVLDDKDTAFGYWLDGGFGYYFKKVVIGADVRWSDASASLAPTSADGDVDLDSGGIQYGAFVGFTW